MLSEVAKTFLDLINKAITISLNSENVRIPGIFALYSKGGSLHNRGS
jgi:hypothetical protein